MSVVEAAYRLDLSEQDCISELTRAVGDVFGRNRPAMAFVLRRTRTNEFAVDHVASVDEEFAATIRPRTAPIPNSVWRKLAAAPPTLTTSTRALGPSVAKKVAEVGGREFTGLVCPTGTSITCIGTTSTTPLQPTPRACREWSSVAAHVSAAWRIRAAVLSELHGNLTFSPEGLLVDECAAHVGGAVRALLRQAVVRREGIRARGETLWPALIAGEWTLVDRFENSGRRVVVAHRNVQSARPFQALTARERTALLRALDGVAGKVIALELGVSEATVSRLVSRALRRLGLKGLGEATALRRMTFSMACIGAGSAAAEFALLRSSPVVHAGVGGEMALPTLTPAERRVLTAVLEGRAQKEIAAERRSSPRTIANQVASIFRKLGVGSRRELVARILGPEDWSGKMASAPRRSL